MTGAQTGLALVLYAVLVQFPIAWLVTHKPGQSFREWVGRW